MTTKWLRWEDGRQEGRYSKLLLAISQRLKFDCYLLKIQDGSAIPAHTDPAIPGYEHHRVNIFLNRFGKYNRNLRIHGPYRSWLNERIVLFRPDKYEHYMRHVDQVWSEKSTYVLSIGWLKKN